MLTAACARSPVTGTSNPDGGSSADVSVDAAVTSRESNPPAPQSRVSAPLDEDGNDDPEDSGHGVVPNSGHFAKVGTAPLALTRICDLTPLGDALYAAHANQPLGTDGATITRYRPNAKSPFSIAFNWNRAGEPTKGGGAGQGFLRVHAIGGRLFVPDADPPYNGLALAEYGTEGYVFVSDRGGSFAPPRAPHARPPGPPDLLSFNSDSDDGRPGAGVLPRAYHVLDVIRFRAALYASTGSVPPKERAWRGPSPGALHRASKDGARWTYEVDYPYPWKNGVWRLTYLVRFRDRLYAGIQDYDGREPNDYVVFAPGSSAIGNPVDSDGGVDAGSDISSKSTDAGGGFPAPLLRREDSRGVRVTRDGSAGTLRWWVDRSATPRRLYWIAWTRGEGISLRVTSDGDHWAAIALPDDAGQPTDIARYRNAVVVLAERGLYRLAGTAIDGPFGINTSESNVEVANVIATPLWHFETGTGASPKKNTKSPFAVGDFFCVAPLAVFNNELYAGGQTGGSLYRFDPSE